MTSPPSSGAQVLPSTHYFVTFSQRPNESDGRDTQGVQVLHMKEAQRYQLASPAVAKVVYVAHPNEPQTLYPFAAYEAEITAKKLNEALRVATALGACEIAAYAYVGKSLKAKAGVDPGPISPVRVGTKFENSDEWEVRYRVQGIGSRPEDPRPLLFPEMPGFDAACEGVLRNGAQEIQLEIFSQGRLSAVGEIAAILKGAGFKLGIDGERTQSSIFVVQAKFPRFTDGEIRQRRFGRS